MALAFEQQRKESDKAFAAFSMYLSLGPARSLVAVAERLGKNRGVMERWSKKFDWAARVQAHGAHMALVEREAAEALARAKGVDWVKRQEEQREKEWALRCKAVQVAEAAIERWLDRPDRCGSLEGIARMLELASKLGHNACGVPAEGHRVEVTGPDGGPIRVEVQAALKKIYGKPLPGEVVDVEEIGKQKTESRNLTGANGANGGSQLSTINPQLPND